MRMPFPIATFSLPLKNDGGSPRQRQSPASSSDTTVDNDREEDTHLVLPFSMQVMKCVTGNCCPNCKPQDNNDDDLPNALEHDDILFCQSIETDLMMEAPQLPQPPQVSPAVFHPMMRSLIATAETERHQKFMEQVLAEYRTACAFYKRPMNSGVLTTLRFHVPFLRVAPDFCDADMLALAEILIRHNNTALRYIRRLDFSKRKLRGHVGFGSHGALTLAKILQASDNVTEVFLERNRIGPYGATAIFIAISKHRNVRTIRMRRCRILEKGARAFAHYVIGSPHSNVLNADLSANYIGYPGCMAIETAMKGTKKRMTMDLEGNLVFQEVMNCITHGLGVLLAFFGSTTLSAAVRGSSQRHVISCAVYSTSLVVLYTSSTLYHSFFSMRNTKWVFEVLDKSAIYILISGSYTPFLQIVLSHKPIWSTYLLGFLWLLCILGITIEFTLPTWQYRRMFSLAMYLSMGWSALVCLPEVARVLPSEAMNLMFLGGVSYTAGVPFFVRDNNLDHAVWHLFVLMGSLFHWLGVYFYVAPYDACTSVELVQNATECAGAP